MANQKLVTDALPLSNDLLAFLRERKMQTLNLATIGRCLEDFAELLQSKNTAEVQHRRGGEEQSENNSA